MVWDVDVLHFVRQVSRQTAEAHCLRKDEERGGLGRIVVAYRFCKYGAASRQYEQQALEGLS